MRVGIVRDADTQAIDRGDQLFAQLVGCVFAHGNHDGQRHAALARRTEGGTGKVVHHLVEIGIGHDDAVVLRAAEGLDALRIRRAARVDILRDVGRSDEADRRNVGMVEDRIDHLLVAMDDLQQALGRARFEEEFGEPHRNARIAFGRCQDEGIARRDRHAEHPHRDHRGEVERGDACTDAERLAHRIDVYAGARTLRVFALQRLRDPAGEFDHLEPALHVAMRILHDLAVFAGEQLGQLLLVRFDEALELEHHARAALRIGHRPFGLDLFRGIDGLLQQRGIAQRDFGLDLARRGVPDLVLASGGGAVPGDEMVDLAHERFLSFLANGSGNAKLRNQPVSNETGIACG